ncbi:phospholipase D-like domain-containing protein [Halostagnicola sp. A-GB9-2]|uniref:phospholipase D-like domain-containing protein n=1 Tax=Halostagnicola sp. A-GB9-2 TaxID=3048066 RepID=UPI0024BFF932|nr:phospholipase D-like domain-containing protein [Halostagnicola sp. A-GB9-2]MDJ1430675.1 phospholipase D-like domain-containing protein [Halostagnicola sp. A-GB9-2]
MRIRALLVAVLVCCLFASVIATALIDIPSMIGDRQPGVDADSKSLEDGSERMQTATPTDTSVQTATPSDGIPGFENTTSALACPKHARADGEPRILDKPRIVELYPNPTTYENVGEFFVLETPPETSLENWTVTDGHTTATFPNETVSDRVAVTTDANETATLTDDSPLELDGHLRLATDGDSLELRNGSERIDTVSYDDAPLAERWYRSDLEEGNTDNPTAGESQGKWWPRDATCLERTTTDADEATAFVLPDSPDIPLETIRDAENRLVVAGYTFTSETIAAELVKASERGVDVDVLLESGPVGGTPEPTESILESLEDGDVNVRATGGEGARYQFHHPKYAIADDTVLVTSENWKPSGLGGDSSRGWGITVEDRELATALETVFIADFEGWDTKSGASHRENTTFVDDETDERGQTEFTSEHRAEAVDVDGVELLLAPDNAQERVRELLAEAEDEILVKQASIGGSGVSLVEETVDAARRGVEVRILLDSSWYVEDDNAELKASLERTAADEELPLEVSLVEPGDRFEKIHAKGVIIDDETTLVGSLNWNDNSLENNREVVLAVHGEEPAAYYRAVFDDDWQGESWSLPVGLSLGVIVALIVAALVGHRYITFGDREVSAVGKSDNSSRRSGTEQPSEDIAQRNDSGESDSVSPADRDDTAKRSGDRPE